MKLIIKHASLFLVSAMIIPSLVEADLIKGGRVLKQPKGTFSNDLSRTAIYTKDKSPKVPTASPTPSCKLLIGPPEEVNVATSQSLTPEVSQSSTLDNNEDKYGAHIATNGNKDTSIDNLAHTGQSAQEMSNPWWKVDLGDTLSISKIVIWNRIQSDGCCDSKDCDCGERLRGFKLQILYENREVWSFEDKGETDLSDSITFTEKDHFLNCGVGNAVKLSIPGEGKILNIREFEVFTTLY